MKETERLLKDATHRLKAKTKLKAKGSKWLVKSQKKQTAAKSSSF